MTTNPDRLAFILDRLAATADEARHADRAERVAATLGGVLDLADATSAPSVGLAVRAAALAALDLVVLAVGSTGATRARLAELALRLVGVVPEALDLAREASPFCALDAHAHAEAAARIVSTLDATTPSGERLDVRARMMLVRLNGEE